MHNQKWLLRGVVKYRCSPEQLMWQHLKHKYGLTREGFQDLYDAQKGVCAICGRKNKKKRPLCIDHDHDTGQVRGLLCYKCNLGLGMFYDSAKCLQRAIEYLEKSGVDKHW